jgi:anion-transporting  ArsA/GET3 family ATPase
MEFIRELLAEPEVDVAALEAEFAELVEQFDAIIDRTTSFLAEGVVQDPAWWEEVLEMAMKRMDAARRGLSLVNKLKGEERKKHASRVFKNMNEIRRTISSIQAKLKDVIINDGPDLDAPKQHDDAQARQFADNYKQQAM